MGGIGCTFAMSVGVTSNASHAAHTEKLSTAPHIRSVTPWHRRSWTGRRSPATPPPPYGKNSRDRDFENLAETLAAFVTVGSIQLALRRLVRASRMA